MINIISLPHDQVETLLAMGGWEFDVGLCLSSEDIILVAVRDGQMLAYLEHRGPQIMAIETHPTAREQGFGRLLVDQLKAQFSAIEACAVQPGSWEFWDKLGFVDGELDDDGSWFYPARPPEGDIHAALRAVQPEYANR